jgi:hypothetical protein
MQGIVLVVRRCRVTLPKNPFAQRCASISAGNDHAGRVVFGELQQNRTVVLAGYGLDPRSSDTPWRAR